MPWIGETPTPPESSRGTRDVFPLVVRASGYLAIGLSVALLAFQGSNYVEVWRTGHCTPWQMWDGLWSNVFANPIWLLAGGVFLVFLSRRMAYQAGSGSEK